MTSPSLPSAAGSGFTSPLGTLLQVASSPAHVFHIAVEVAALVGAFFAAASVAAAPLGDLVGDAETASRSGDTDAACVAAVAATALLRAAQWYTEGRHQQPGGGPAGPPEWRVIEGGGDGDAAASSLLAAAAAVARGFGESLRAGAVAAMRATLVLVPAVVAAATLSSFGAWVAGSAATTLLGEAAQPASLSARLAALANAPYAAELAARCAEAWAAYVGSLPWALAAAGAMAGAASVNE